LSHSTSPGASSKSTDWWIAYSLIRENYWVRYWGLWSREWLWVTGYYCEECVNFLGNCSGGLNQKHMSLERKNTWCGNGWPLMATCRILRDVSLDEECRGIGDQRDKFASSY
jgi:hypothetical protein